MKVADLSGRGRRERQLRTDTEAAIATLVRRSSWMHRRAIRAPVWSNERVVMYRRSEQLKAVAFALSSDGRMQESLQGDGTLDRGWRALGEAVVAYLGRKAAAAKRADKGTDTKEQVA